MSLKVTLLGLGVGENDSRNLLVHRTSFAMLVNDGAGDDDRGLVLRSRGEDERSTPGRLRVKLRRGLKFMLAMGELWQLGSYSYSLQLNARLLCIANTRRGRIYTSTFIQWSSFRPVRYSGLQRAR